MGRQAYLTRLALGRSPYDALQYVDALESQDESQHGDSEQSGHQPETLNTAQTGSRASGSYVQQYDRCGHPINPVSRSLARQSRRAQNDILATVGVCTRPEQAIDPSQDSGERRTVPTAKTSKLANAMLENNIGLTLSLADLTEYHLLSWSTLGLLNRFQVGSLYASNNGVQILSLAPDAMENSHKKELGSVIMVGGGN
ncbi:MAG: hypothetical protein Q9190_007875 [Brigantiaea leucoxantha]